MSELAIQRYLKQTRAAEGTKVPLWAAPDNKVYFPAVEGANYQVTLAQSIDDLRDAQRLRFSVFQAEYGAVFSSSAGGIDEDEFDAYCDHLIVRLAQTQEIVGTYRILTPYQAKRIGRYYSQSEFFMPRIERHIPDLIELGRSCVHPEHRNGVVIMLLWSAIARFMKHHGYQHLIGCASVSMRDGGALAASLWDQFRQESMVDPMLEAFPKHPLQLDEIDRLDSVEVPPLIRGYLRIGARICGEPNWDPDFNSADFLMLLDLQKIDPRYGKHFGLL